MSLHWCKKNKIKLLVNADYNCSHWIITANDTKLRVSFEEPDILCLF